ncbi:MAG TPA: clostripain-related cysteine peptidase, partial [Elusimicrobiales bacterium]|nr:clostripain-related cysteine peptidase [Elusimicrobiales bacterium]
EKLGSGDKIDILAQVSHFEVKGRPAYASSQPGDKFSSGGILLEGAKQTDPYAALAMPPSQNSTGTRRYHIIKDSSGQLISSLEIGRPFEADAGSEKTLRDFLLWGRLYSPAKHYMLIIFNHGAGYPGISYDYGKKTHITPDGVARALSAIGGADVLILGGCFMQMAEVAQRLRGAADYLVGSEEVGWGMFYGDLTDNFKAASPKKLALLAAANAHKNQPADILSSKVLTQSSVLDLKRSADLTPLLDAWTQAMMQAKELQAARFARDHAQRFSTDLGEKYKFYRSYCDLHDYVRLATEQASSEAVKAAGAALMQYIDEELVLKTHSRGYAQEPHGLSIYMPEDKIAKDYPALGLPNTLKWLQFLEWVGPKAEFLTLEQAKRQP